MAVYGYARVSTNQQDLSIQIDTLRSAGAGIIRSEKMSGSSVNGREELKTLIQFLRNDDTLLITRILLHAIWMIELFGSIIVLSSG